MIAEDSQEGLVFMGADCSALPAAAQGGRNAALKPGLEAVTMAMGSLPRDWKFMMKRILQMLVVQSVLATVAQAITIGAGPVIGTNKNTNVTGSAVWYQELQDWTKDDLRAGGFYYQVQQSAQGLSSSIRSNQAKTGDKPWATHILA